VWRFTPAVLDGAVGRLQGAWLDLKPKAQAACNDFNKKMYRLRPDVSTGFCGLHDVMPQGAFMPDLFIPQEEFSEWLYDEPHLVTPLLQGYSEAISDMGGNLLKDPRSSKNAHVLNPDFAKQQRYFMGVQPLPEQFQLVLSCLYVFPEFRGSGLGKHLINTAKQMIQDKGFIQVAVEEQKIPQLDSFYKNQDFLSTDDIIPNGFGIAYRDYFWSAKKISLSRIGNTIAVQPL
jgi:GNAT superfamily N-acetyltransferase